jgi:hypothetical protein
VYLQKYYSETKNDIIIHPSFSTILKDKTRGGRLLRNVILNLHKQNKLVLCGARLAWTPQNVGGGLGIPLFLTPMGIKASHALINMLNLLPTNNNSEFKGENLLLGYLSSKSNMMIRYNMENSLKTIIPIVSYNLPIANQMILDGDCSAGSAYYIVLNTKITGKYGIGSALSCRNRLNDHINSLNGHRLRSKLHDWILKTGGITSVE